MTSARFFSLFFLDLSRSSIILIDSQSYAHNDARSGLLFTQDKFGKRLQAICIVGG